MKLAVLSPILPPSPSGQAMVLHRLLRTLKPEDYCLLSTQNYETCSGPQKLPARYYHLSPLNLLPRSPGRCYHLLSKYLEVGSETSVTRSESGSVPLIRENPASGELARSRARATRKLASRLRTVLRVVSSSQTAHDNNTQAAHDNNLQAMRESESFQILQRARSVWRIVRREKCDAILACSGDPFDLPVGYLVSRWARIPLYVYLFDDYLYQWTHPLHPYCVPRWAEPAVLRGATGIIVPNELLRDEYRCRYGVDPIVIHNPAELIENRVSPAWPANEGEIRIVYTGAVYYVHHNAFRNLITAIRQLDRLDVKLHLYTAQPLKELKREGIRGPVVYNGHLASSDVLEVQRRADILFLPLAFSSPTLEVVKTAAPGKMGEYLGSGRPILVHAPADSFVSRYFREHECGVVVDRSEPEMLKQAIRRILDGTELRRRVVENARVRAMTDFNPVSAKAKLLKLLQAGEKE